MRQHRTSLVLAPALAASIALAVAASSARAAELVIPAAGEGWHLRLEAPAMQAETATYNEQGKADGRAPAAYYGHADRLQVSMFVDKPMCRGAGDSDEEVYDCFAAMLKRNPLVVWDTERGNKVPNGVQVMYMMDLKAIGQSGRSFNVNLLFGRHGKWTDLHLSVASPTKADVDTLFSIMESVKIEDDAPAAPH